MFDVEGPAVSTARDHDCMAEIVLEDPHGNGPWLCAICRTVFVYPVHVQSALTAGSR